MNPEAQRIAIAEVCGWFDFRRDLTNPSLLLGTKSFGHIGCEEFEVPNYPASLDAMHEAENVLTPQQQADYYRELHAILHKGMMSLRHQQWLPVIRATAAQRAEAFLRTIGKWKDDSL